MPPTSKTKRKKRRRKSRYKTGIHRSPKCSLPIHYRSGWEKVICQYLDDNPEVDSYEYESLKLPYINNIKYQKVRFYFPDFLVTYSDGRKILVEVKRQNQLNNLKVMKKAEAGRIWAKNNKAEYQFWTDNMILPLQKMYKIRAAGKKKAKKKQK